MSSGSISGLGFESNTMSGTGLCAAVPRPAATIAADRNVMKRFIASSPFLPAAAAAASARATTRFRRRRSRSDCGSPSCGRLEIRRTPCSRGRTSDDRAVELHLVDLAGVRPGAGPVAVRIGIRREHVLMRARRDAHGPAGAEVRVLFQRLEIVVELLIAIVRPVGRSEE